MQVTLPDGTVWLAQGRLDLVPPQRPRNPEFALYLDSRWGDDPQVAWPFCLIGWEDFGLPVDEAELFVAIDDVYRRARAGDLVEIACYGGIGRTGTVLGCLSVLAGLSATEALSWVRTNYHSSAIETVAQEQLITRFAQALKNS
jgi:protein tyrosine phosphatase